MYNVNREQKYKGGIYYVKEMYRGNVKRDFKCKQYNGNTS